MWKEKKINIFLTVFRAWFYFSLHSLTRTLPCCLLPIVFVAILYVILHSFTCCPFNANWLQTVLFEVLTMKKSMRMNDSVTDTFAIWHFGCYSNYCIRYTVKKVKTVNTGTPNADVLILSRFKQRFRIPEEGKWNRFKCKTGNSLLLNTTMCVVTFNSYSFSEI